MENGMKHPRRATLTAALFAYNCGRRLPLMLADLEGVADEIMVVDDGSSDDTLAIAEQQADVVVRFEHTGRVGPARLLPLEHASGDWVLILEDDERPDDAFAWLVDELLETPLYTHYWLPRKWLAEARPPISGQGSSTTPRRPSASPAAIPAGPAPSTTIRSGCAMSQALSGFLAVFQDSMRS